MNDRPPTGAYRVGTHNQRNLYRINRLSDNHKDDEHVGVVFDPAFGPVVAAALNAAHAHEGMA